MPADNASNPTAMAGAADKTPRWKLLLPTVYEELFRTQVFTVAAALAFYFLLAFVPLLLLLSSMLRYLPIPNLIGEFMTLLARLVPGEAMQMLNQVLDTVLAANGSKLITIGIVGTIWAASGGFSACIDALNVAYDAQASRPWWRDRLQAIVLTLTSGALAVVALVAMILGPEFAHFLERMLNVQLSFAPEWPAMQVAVTFLSFSVAAVLLYALAPTVKPTVRSTVPGAILAVSLFFLCSYGLRIYVEHLMNSSKTYGALGAVVALMLWLYLMAVALLIGAETNATLVQLSGRRLVGSREPGPGTWLPGYGLVPPDGAQKTMQRRAASTKNGNSDDCRASLASDLAAKDGLDTPVTAEDTLLRPNG